MTDRGRVWSAQTQLRVGRLTKAHGLKGGLKLELFTDDPDRRFTPGSSFALQVPEDSPWFGKRLELAELRWYNGQPVGFFADVVDRSGAESLAKAILWIDQDPDEPAEPDAWYDHQLVGLDVVRDGQVVGVLDRLEHLPAQDLLVVKVDDREVLVPFVRALVPEVDLAARRIVVTPPDGLFEPLPDESDADESDAVGRDAVGRGTATPDAPVGDVAAASPDETGSARTGSEEIGSEEIAEER